MKLRLIICLILVFCMVLPVATVAAGDDTEITGTVPLVASDVAASNIGYYSATISWKTSDNSTSQVFYDTIQHDSISDYSNNTTVDASLVLAHSVGLTGLASGTTYHYRAKSAIPATDFIDVSADYTFTTLSTPAGGGGGGGGGVAPPPTPPGTTDVRGMATPEGRFTGPVTITSGDKLCTLTIPKDTVGLDKDLKPLTQISVAPMTTPPAPPAQANVIGLAYDFGPDGATFSPPITLIFSYDPTKIPAGVNEKDLVLAFYDKATGQWVTLSDIVVDLVNHTISGETSHFTAFSVIAYTRPATFALSALTISPTELKSGESVSISVDIANTGDLVGSYDVTLNINNTVVETKQVTLAGHTSQKVTFTTSRNAAGSYTVSIDTLSGIFTVEPVPTPAPAPAPPTPAPPTPAPTPTPWGLIGGSIAGVIVIIALLVYFLWWRRRLA